MIAEQEHKFGEVRKTADNLLISLNRDIDVLQLKTRHSLISPDAFVDAVATAVTDFKKYLDKLAEQQDGVATHDKLRDEIAALFANRIGPPPKDQAELDDIYKQGRDRYAQEVPPGYMDLKKEGSHTFGTLRHERKFGDLVLWEQLIREANARDLRHVIFITDDDKEDWWWIVKSNGPKTQGPRPELVEELRQRSKVELFYMYSSERFLKYANEYLGTIVEERTIDVVRALSRSKRAIADLKGLQFNAERRVLEWIAKKMPHRVIEQSGFPDFLIRTADDRVDGIEVRYVRPTTDIGEVTSSYRYDRHADSLRRRGVTSLTVIFVARHTRVTTHLIEALRGSEVAFGYIVGSVERTLNGGFFVPLFSNQLIPPELSER